MNTKFAGVLLMTSLLLAACEESKAPMQAVAPTPDPELVRQIDATLLGDILISKNGTPCLVVYKTIDTRGVNREVNCRDGVPLFGNSEYLAKIFTAVVKKSDSEYVELLAKHFEIGRRLSY